MVLSLLIFSPPVFPPVYSSSLCLPHTPCFYLSCTATTILMALQCKVETEKEIATRGQAAAFWAYGLGIPAAYLEAKFPPRPEDWLRLVVVLKVGSSHLLSLAG